MLLIVKNLFNSQIDFNAAWNILSLSTVLPVGTHGLLTSTGCFLCKLFQHTQYTYSATSKSKGKAFPAHTTKMYKKGRNLEPNKFNVVHFSCNYTIIVNFNTKLLHSTFICSLMFRHVSALTVGHFQGAFFSMCSLCFNLYVKKFHI